jgi:hypothetical protein
MTGMGSKSKTLASVLVILFLILFVMLPNATVKAQTRTLIVPDQYATIQDAVYNASTGEYRDS